MLASRLTLTTQSLCQRFQGCRWTTAECTGFAVSCDEITDGFECSQQQGCTWQ